MTAGQNSICINKNYQSHDSFSTGSIHPHFYALPNLQTLYFHPPQLQEATNLL